MPRYEFVQGTSSKFWQIELDGESFTTTYGKIGTDGKSTTKSFDSAEKAQREYDKLVKQKTKKGYVLADASGGAPAPKAKAKPAPAAAATPAAAPAGGPVRYEFEQGTSSKFWEIRLDGTDVVTTYGKIGSKGKSSTKSFGSAAAAQKEHDKLVKQKTKKGYVLANASGGAPSSRERIVGLEKETAGGNDEHAGTFLFRGVVPFDPEKGLSQAGRGKAYAVRLEDPYDTDVAEFVELLKTLIADDDASKLKALVLGCWGSPMNANDQAIYDTLLAAKHELTSLNALFIADAVMEESECSWIELGNWASVLGLPTLEHLRVRGNGTPRAPLLSPTLRSLCLQTGGLPRETARAVASASFPNLEHLELWLGTDDYGGNTTPEDLAPIFSGKLFPRLRYLGLRNAREADAFAQAVATAPILEQIEVLDLSLGAIGNAGAEALLASPAVAKLKRLDLHLNYMDDATRKKVKALRIDVDVSAGDAEEEDWGDGDMYRYIALTE